MNRYLIKVFLEHFAFGLTLSVSVVWMLAQGLSLTQIALIESLALALGLAIDIPTGFLSDKFGRKFILVGASILQSASFLIFAFSQDFWQFLVAAILLAIGFAFTSGSEEAYIYENKSDGNYRKIFSSVNVVDETATIIGLLVTPLLISVFTLQSVFVVASIVIFITAVVSWFILSNKTKKDVFEAKQKIINKRQLLMLIRHNIPLILLFIIFAVYYEAGRVFWQPQLLNSGFKIEQLGFLFALFKVASLIGAYVGRHQKLSPKIEIVIIGFLITVSFLLIASSVWILVIIGFFLYSLFENIYRIIESNYLQGMAGDKNRASFLSAASFVRQGYSVVSLPLISIVAITNISYVFYIFASLQVAAAMVFWIFTLRSK